MRHSIALIIIFFFIVSCSGKKEEKQLVSFDKMKVVLLQLIQVDEYYNRVSFRDSTLRLAKKNVTFYKQVFELNNVDRSQFYETIDYYEKHPIEMKILMDSVNALCKKKKEVYAPLIK